MKNKIILVKETNSHIFIRIKYNILIHIFNCSDDIMIIFSSQTKTELTPFRLLTKTRHLNQNKINLIEFPFESLSFKQNDFKIIENIFICQCVNQYVNLLKKSL
jgi:hypothetical protein